MNFLCNKPQEITVWWNWWCGEMPCCKTKFAETTQQPNSGLSCGAGSMPRRNWRRKEDMVEVREKVEKSFKDGNAVPGIRSSHHFIPQSASQIRHELCSEDDLLVDIHDFKIPTRVDIGDIAPSSYISCEYNSLWYVGLVNRVDEEQDDVDVQFMHPHGPRKTFNWPQGGDSCYVSIKNIVLYRHLLQALEELTESVMKILTKWLLRLQNFICEQLLIWCCENMLWCTI